MKKYLPFIMVAAAAIATSKAVGHWRPFSSIKATRGKKKINIMDSSSDFDICFAEIIENYEVVRPIITVKDSHLVSTLPQIIVGLICYALEKSGYYFVSGMLI